jgi:aminoglycoside phosphotransferase (APT) family kinase protein
MQQTLVQPNASHIPGRLVRSILRSTLGMQGRTPSYTLVNHGHYSNDLAEVALADGRTLIVKRGRYPWSSTRFRTARIAANLLRQHTDLIAPLPLDLPGGLGDRPLDAYWRIDLPTVSGRWGMLPLSAQRLTMRSLGAMIRRVHQVQLAGHGPLAAAQERPAPLSLALAEDLGGRLMPAIAAQWREGIPLVEALLEIIPEAARRAPTEGVLLHGDLHSGNVLWNGDASDPRCVGLLDLEDAHGGPKESDLARLSVIHTELFEQPLASGWFEWVKEGYGTEVDSLLLRYYRVHHLVNLGYHSASIGHQWHASQIAAAARGEVAALRTAGGER